MVKKKLTLKEEFFIARLLSVKVSAKTIARIMDLPLPYVRKIKKRSGIKIFTFRSNYLTRSKEETIVHLFQKGYPIDKIALLLDITGERVIKVLERRGIFS